MPASSPERVAFLIDGFNLYHSITEAVQEYKGSGMQPPPLKWLNIRELCEANIQHFRINRAEVASVHYFTALAKHLITSKPDVVTRHKILIRALQSTGVQVELGRFKRKEVWCTNCRQSMPRHEEKETDVAICLKLLELFMLDECDTAVLVTGDTDVAPAIRTAKRLFPNKHVGILFPFARKNKELAQLCHLSVVADKEQYKNHQFPNPIRLPNGKTLTKPASW